MSCFKINEKQSPVLSKLISEHPNLTVWLFSRSGFEQDYIDVEFEGEKCVTVSQYSIFEDGSSKRRWPDSEIEEDD